MKIEIICTLGPSSMNDRVIARLEEFGVSFLRINLSHTKLENLADAIRYIQERTSIPICLDTEGAQIRTGQLQPRGVFLPENSIVRVRRSLVCGDSNNLNFYPTDVIDKLEIGDFISIDFNSVLTQIIERDRDGLIMRILVGGLAGSNRAVTVERDILMPPLTGKDREALAIGIRMGIRHVALSFAGSGPDVDEIRAVLGKGISVISKIESIKGVINLEEIAAKSDALLLDRGDLSRQVPIERIPRLQKDIIKRAKKCGTKIYVATNLLESMTKVPTPTRAEVNDIFNTLNDGADGLVLAAETAIGSYPINCVTMVSKVVKQFSSFSGGYSPEELKRRDSLLLVEPHGGVLINRFNCDFDTDKIKRYKTLEVDKTVLLDAEQIALGTFSPLEGFMGRKALESVLENYRLPSGIIWPLPITLQIKREKAPGLTPGDNIALKLENTPQVYAILELGEIYTYDLGKISARIFGTDSLKHPGVQLLKNRGNLFLGGKITLVRRLASAYKHFEMTPRQTRAIFENKNWSKVVGFHTRNVIHRAHEHIQMLALQRHNCDGIFIHPVVGPKKKDDYNADIILKSYELMLGKFYPRGRVILGAFQNYSRYSGPREAVFTAICRKNFGCSHFIIGRDHTGVADFYGPKDAHRLFDSLGNIGITPVFFEEVHYCKKCKSYVEDCKHGRSDIVNINGTEARKMLKAKKLPPDWFIRKDIADLVLDEIEKGKEIFIP
jgi:pyruvate kinase